MSDIADDISPGARKKLKEYADRATDLDGQIDKLLRFLLNGYTSGRMLSRKFGKRTREEARAELKALITQREIDAVGGVRAWVIVQMGAGATLAEVTERLVPQLNDWIAQLKNGGSE